MGIQIIADDESFTVTVDEVEFDLRRLTDEAKEEIDRRHRVRRLDSQGRVYYEIPDDRKLARLHDFCNHLILGWRGVTHPTTGAEVPCTPENKARLPGNTKVRLIQLAELGSIAEFRLDPTNGSGRRSDGN